MLNQVQFLWPFVLIYCCVAIKSIKCNDYQYENEDDLQYPDLKIKAPENCTISKNMYSFHPEYIMTCPDFNITMGQTHFDLKYYRNSIVKCTPNSLPYEYLRRANSSRDALTLYCQVPENGSFGEGWPQLEYLEVKNSGPWKREHFSGLNKLKVLLIRLSNSSHEMPDDLFADLGNLSTLSLYVKHLNKNVLNIFRELEVLDLRFESIKCLDNFDASELKNELKVKSLLLNRINFKPMSKQFFEGFSVEILILRGNDIEAIDANAFEALTSLKTVLFEFNKLNSLPSALFSNNKKLEEVTFVGELRTLPFGFLSNLPNLRQISISCQLTSIPSDLISGSTNLEVLYISSDELTSMPRDLLYNHTKLKVIDLSGKNIFDLPNDHFYNKSNLTEIRLSSGFW